MSFLATADLQAEWSNLDLCEQSWNEMLRICRKHKLRYIVFCGDGKEAYDPISIRIVKWWDHAIRKAIKEGLEVFYLLGNHDRIATYSEAGNWLSILKRAGARTFDKPEVVQVDNRRFFMLPYAPVKQTKEWAKELLKRKPDRRKDVLFFHCNLLEARYSQHDKKSDSSISTHDLGAIHYHWCIGGDIHFPQRIKVVDGKKRTYVYYTGSSFCHDWGEANQRKRYLVVRKNSITSVHSRIPRWFDSSVSGFHRAAPSNWREQRVRITVQCDASEDYGKRLERARQKALETFPGAEIFVVPKFKDGSTEVSGISTTDSDEHKIREYVKQTGHELRGQIKETSVAVKYMLHVLSHFTGGLRTSAGVRFNKAEGKNFLSFKKLNIDLRHEGITVIQGINQDRNNKSNGSGKTSLMQILPVALFGRTFKGQSSDHWSNRWSRKDEAFARLKMMDSKGRTVEIQRGRRPTMLKLLVNGHNQSSGMKSTDRSGTQSQIESVVGFTWETLANAVYIDRTISAAFLSGTKSKRTEVLSRFQNLERFEKALKYVRKDNQKNDEKYQFVSNRLSRMRGKLEEMKNSLVSLKDLRKLQLKGAYNEYRRYKKQFKRHSKHTNSLRNKLEKRSKRLEKTYSRATNKLSKQEKQVAMCEQRWQSAKSWADRYIALKGKEECPTCFQPIDRKQLSKNRKKVIVSVKEAAHKLDEQEKILTHLRKKVQLLDGKQIELQTKLGKIEDEEKHLKLSMMTAQGQYQELVSRRHTAYTIIEKTREGIMRVERKKHELKQYKSKLSDRHKLYQYAIQAFSRDGIPAYLNKCLVPVLNKAAEYYADIFTDGEIQVRMSIEKGDFVPQVINTKGGEDIDDQSTGELSIAGLITSFALREAAPQTNLLLLDEPSEGLDEQTSRQFARGLQKLRKRFKTIFLCTHNKAIESALEGSREIVVVKKNGISRIKEAA